MATGLSPLANTALKSVAYSDPQFTVHQTAIAPLGSIAVAAVAGNGAYGVFTAAFPCNVYQTTVTVVTPSLVAAGTLTPYVLRANNGANLSSNIAVGNAMTIGVNVAGNVQTTGPYTFNVFPNGAVSSSNTSPVGGLALNTGDTIIFASTCNTLVAVAATEYSVTPSASVLA